MPRKPNILSRFWQELKRRNVHRSLAVYAGTAFVILEATTIIFPRWGLPDWAIDIVIYLLILGAVVTITVSWIFDITQEGVKKTKSLDEEPEGEKTVTSNSWKIATYASLVVIVALIVFNVFSRNRLSKDLLNLEHSIAVLPFENLIPDSLELWFTDGISDVISSQLTKISDFRITNRKSTLLYKGEKKTIAEIGEELSVNYIILGTAQKMGAHIRIIVQLVSVNNEAQLWSDLYDREWKDIFDIQTDIARNIAANMEAVLSSEETESIEDFGTENSDALEYYQKGNLLLYLWNEDAFRRAVDMYQRAIDLDPGFAQAYAGKVMATFELTSWDVDESDFTLIPEAREYALKAIAIDENLGDPYYVIGCIKYLHEWDWQGAEEFYRKGMELNPNNVWARISYANLLSIMRRFEESISICEVTVKLNPLDPNSDAANGLLFQYYVDMGIHNQFVSEYLNDMMEDHDHDIRKVYDFELYYLFIYYASLDQRDSMKIILDECIRRTEIGDPLYDITGEIYYALGETEKAIEFFEKSYETRQPFMYIINAEMRLEPLRSNPRFQELIRKLGFDI
jgi:TolB-like protein